MDINDIYLLLGYLSRQKGSGMIGPNRYNSYCALVNLKYFKRYLGLPEQYQVGSPLPAIAYQVSQGVSDRISKFIVPELLIPRSPSGYYPSPADYVTFSSMRSRFTYQDGECGTSTIELDVKMMPDAEFTDRLGSTLKPPTIRRAIGTWTSFGFRIAPTQIDQALLTYLRYPATPFRAYTAGDVYNPAGSTQFEYPDICSQDILALLLDVAGLGVQDQEVIAAAQRVLKVGI